MTDSYIYIITALLPLAALMLVFQVNPYHALVIRGILGAIAALTYTVMGAADVALTEALVGTLLAGLLYAIAVRSSLVLRLGVLKDEPSDPTKPFSQLIEDLRSVFNKHHMRIELVPYFDTEDLQQALVEKEVHAICVRSKPDPAEERPPYQTTIRLHRLYEIMQTELASPITRLSYVNPAEAKEAH